MGRDIRAFLQQNEGENEATVLEIFLQIGHTESMVPGAEKDRKMMPLTWKKSWKVVPEIRWFWPENEGENEATVLEFFLQIGHIESMVSGAEKDRKMMPLTWKKSWKVAFKIRASWHHKFSID